MALRVAINGLGRIGRCVLRALVEEGRSDLELVAVNGPASTETHVHLLSYDSVHGIFPHVKQTGDDQIDIGAGSIPVFHERDPEKLPWGELDVDIVFECTGRFKTAEDIEKHLNAGAKRVIVSAPAEGADKMIVYGVNNDTLTAADRSVSVGSCTTNCLAPVVSVLHQAVGIERGFMTTVHAYTNDQNLTDGTHKDLRRARAAGMSMIPTSTGAAKAISVVLPELTGRLDGVAIRVPTPNVSLVDFTFTASRPTSVSELNEAVKKGVNGPLEGVLAVNEAPLVSIDFLHNAHSSIFDATGTKVTDGVFCRVAAWYDNEWGFSVRMLDVAALVGKLL